MRPSDKTVLCQLRSGATVQPFDFPEISLFPQRASASRAAFQGHCPPAAHALCARNSFKYIAPAPSVQALPALLPGALIHSSAPYPSTRKPLGHLPSPEDGPRTPTGQSLASEMLPSELSCGLRLARSRSLITAGRSFLCSAQRRKVRTPWIEQSAYQTCFSAKSLQTRALAVSTYPKPEKPSSSAPLFGRNQLINPDTGVRRYALHD